MAGRNRPGSSTEEDRFTQSSLLGRTFRDLDSVNSSAGKRTHTLENVSTVGETTESTWNRGSQYEHEQMEVPLMLDLRRPANAFLDDRVSLWHLAILLRSRRIRDSDRGWDLSAFFRESLV